MSSIEEVKGIVLLAMDNVDSAAARVREAGDLLETVQAMLQGAFQGSGNQTLLEANSQALGAAINASDVSVEIMSLKVRLEEALGQL